MAKNRYKQVGFNEKLSSEVGYEDFKPLEDEKKIADQLGFTDLALNQKNIRELSRAKEGINEVYVAASSAGSPTTKLVFTDGVLTEIITP